MTNNPLTRRSFIKNCAASATPSVLAAALPLIAAQPDSGVPRKLKIICVGGHPDDPESGCGGTLLRYAALGHAVTVVYLTRGERGIADKGLDESARIRTAEAETACRMIGAKPVFFGQIDGATELTRAHVDAMTKTLAAENPDILFAHWPIDTHMDHQVAGLLTLRAWMSFRERPHLYLFEVDTGSQTQGFLPDTYVDISAVVEKKKAALFAHESQNGRAVWSEHHEIMAAWRGREAGVRAAEAFVRLNRGSEISGVPGLHS